MISRKRPKLVLAIYFQTSGFGFALLEDRSSPVDWGASEIKGRHRAKRCLQRIDALLALHTPDVLVLQDTINDTRRAPRIRALNRRTLQHAKRRHVPVYTYSRERVLDYFEELGATTKHRIAETIARHTPALDLYVPPRRKPWNSEDPRMGIFEAIALAWLFLRSTEKASPF